MEIKKILIKASLVSVLTASSACTGGVHFKSVLDDSQYYYEYGETEALYAKSAERNGLITNGKATPDNDTSYWSLLRARAADSIEKFKKQLGDKPKILHPQNAQ